MRILPPTMGQAFPEADMVCGSKKSNLRRCWLVSSLSCPSSFIYSLLNFAGGGNGNPLRYSCLENPMDGEAWLATVDGVAKSQTRLSEFTPLHFWILQIACLVYSRFLEFLLFSLLLATEASDLVLATQDNVSVRRQGSSLLYLYPLSIFSCQH